MLINYLKYCYRQAVISLSRNRWLALVSASMIAVSLAILGGFLLAAVNANQAMQNIQSNLEIVVFLEEGAEISTLERKIEQLEGIVHCTFVDKHTGLQEFGRSLGDEALLAELAGEHNPLPDIFRVRAREGELVPLLAGQIEQFPGVEAVDYGRELVQTITGISRWLYWISVCISALLAVGAIFLVGTTIRLSVVIRQEEIGIMKYLGASDWFIRLPFLLEGLTIGWTGTLAAVVALGLAYYQFAALLLEKSPLFFLQPVTSPGMLAAIFGGLLLLGTAMGGLGSVFSIRRFLRV
ncbi:MAG: ABC transporter permease [Firmicutes bacterium]|mgnify:CR=1 FL=1|jgi:cell division transport system permease protein|nr:ABC transporter permease [Bacillota bacterium]HPU01216.1 permease-like cell division protein FtsX [Bacillota bacterium]